jgi:hypothetical protein
VPLARDWARRLRRGADYPDDLDAFRARCAAAGQPHPTPLLLRYGPGGYNRLHQDRYGEIAFPLQAAIGLGEPDRDYTGGEFLLVEQRARMQSRGVSIALARGCVLLFASNDRPVPGRRASARKGAVRSAASARKGAVRSAASAREGAVRSAASAREGAVRSAEWSRASLRHGVSRVHSGQRTALGIIFHDAKS